MISLHNARFTSLALLVSLVAAPFMVPTPALGANRMAVRAMQRGMQRRTLEYGFSLVDLIADNPWKSGLVAGGVTALLIYLLSKPVRKKVNKGFAYVGGGFKKAGEGASSLGHQAKLQWNKRVTDYLKDSNKAAYQKLREDYAQQELDLQPHAANKPDTVRDRFNQAEAAFNKAQSELQAFENGPLSYFEQNEKAIKAGEKPMQKIAVVAPVQNQAEVKGAAAAAALQKPSAEGVQAEYVRLQAEHVRLENAHLAVSRDYLVAKEDYEKAKRLFKETGDILESIAYRNGFSREQLGTFGTSTVALSKLSAEIGEIKKRIAKKEATRADMDKYAELISEQRELAMDIEKKQKQLKDQFAHQQAAQAPVPVAPQPLVPDQVPAPLQVQAPVAPQAHDRASEVAEQGLADRAFPVSSSSTGSSSSTSVLSSSSASSSSTSSSSSAALGSV